MNLAGAFAQLGLRVLVVDMDRQKSAFKWHSISVRNGSALPFEVVSWAHLKEDFLESVGPRLEEFDLVLVDCPPAMESIVPWTALLASDFVIIPVVPDYLNLWGSKDAEDLVNEARAERKKRGIGVALDAAFVISSDPKGVVSETCQETWKGAARIPILKSTIGRRKSYLLGPVMGTTTALFRKNQASAELHALAMELAKELKIRIKRQK